MLVFCEWALQENWDLLFTVAHTPNESFLTFEIARRNREWLEEPRWIIGEEFFHSAHHHTVHFCIYLKINSWPLVIFHPQSRTLVSFKTIILTSVTLTQRWFWLVRGDKWWAFQNYQLSVTLLVWPEWSKCVFVICEPWIHGF